MTNPNQFQPGGAPRDPAVLRVQGVATAVLLAPATYAVVPLALQLTGAMPESGFVGDMPPILKYVLLVVGVFSIAVSFLLRKTLEQQIAGQDSTPEGCMRIVLIGLAVAQSPAVFGLVYGLITGELIWAFGLIGMGLLASIRHFPMWGWIEQMCDQDDA